MKFNIRLLFCASVVFSTHLLAANKPKTDFCGIRLREHTVGLTRPGSVKNTLMPASLVLTELGLENLAPDTDKYFFEIKKSSLAIDPSGENARNQNGVLFDSSKNPENVLNISFSENGGLTSPDPKSKPINSVLVLGDGKGELLPYLVRQRLSRVFAVDRSYIAKDPESPIIDAFSNDEVGGFDEHYSKDYGAHLIGMDVREIGRGAAGSEKLKNGFDLVVSHNVLSTAKLEDQVTILKGSYSLLNPGGQMRHALVIGGDDVRRLLGKANYQQELKKILASQISAALKGADRNLNVTVTLSDIHFRLSKINEAEIAWADSEGMSKQEYEATMAYYGDLYKNSFGERIVANIIVTKPAESSTWIGRLINSLF